jgi:negative modulator of initiation of replication
MSMRTIEVEEDVYRHLLASAEVIGEDASSILRRLLGVRPDVTVPQPLTSEFAEFLNSADFQRQRTATHRFLAILGEVHRRSPQDFHRVLSVQGRKRSYFGRSREELATSGRNVEPRQIPGSSFWVMTNASTSYKKRVLREAMAARGYSRAVQMEVAGALGRT